MCVPTLKPVCGLCALDSLLPCGIVTSVTILLDHVLVPIDTMTTVNTGFFHGAQNVTVTESHLTEVHGDNVCLCSCLYISFYKLLQIVNYISSASADQIAPLSPIKHSSALFTGRDSYLKILKDHFGSHSITQRKFYLLFGMGGIGKTQICLKFIE